MSASRKRISIVVSLLVLTAMILSACQQATADDLLGQIKTRGTIRISTDPNYAPQSSLVAAGQRAANTKCAADQLTAGQLEGFDIDTAVEVAKRLGVEACFVTPTWDTITAGSWGGQWDISVGSMTITKPRQQVVFFSPGYYFTPAQFAVAKDSGINTLADLNGKPVCVGSSTTYEDYLNGKLGIPDSDIKAPAPTGVQVVSLETDAECAQAIQSGRKEFAAFLTSATVVDQSISKGIPVVKLGPPVFIENLAVAIDKKASKDTKSLLDAISNAITAMHTDGSLKTSSVKWFGADLTTLP
ncbi:MAG TPA: transporter substrate-binding domain-containing protein [Anaerolineae bacterium]|nr:transporter substrate-binding domain-containing protein [Anaerolineae bacterium]